MTNAQLHTRFKWSVSIFSVLFATVAIVSAVNQESVVVYVDPTSSLSSQPHTALRGGWSMPVFMNPFSILSLFLLYLAISIRKKSTQH